MEYRRRMFDIFDITGDEEDFINNVHAMGGEVAQVPTEEIHRILAMYYLAKHIESGSKASTTSANKLFYVTLAIAFIAGAQVIVALIG